MYVQQRSETGMEYNMYVCTVGGGGLLFSVPPPPSTAVKPCLPSERRAARRQLVEPEK